MGRGKVAHDTACPSRERPPADPPAKRGRASALCCDLCQDECKKNCKNWPTKTEEHGQVVSLGNLCLACDAYRTDSNLDESAFAKLKPKDRDVHMQRRNEYLENKADPQRRSFDPEAIDLITLHGARLEERFPIMLKSDFKAQYGMEPEEAKLNLMRGVDYKRDAVTGVVIRPAKPQVDLVVWSEKAYINKTGCLSEGRHLYAEQSSLMMDSLVGSLMKNMGQELAGKYKAKLKSVQSYTEEEVEQAVTRARMLRRQGSKSGVALLVGDDSDDETGEDNEASGVPEDEVKEEPDAMGAQGGGQSSKDLESSSSAATRPAQAATNKVDTQTPKKRLVLAVKAEHGAESPGASTDAGGAASSETPRAQVLCTPTSTTEVAENDEELTESLGRAKTPKYWIEKLNPTAILNGRNFARELTFARDCIPRATRQGAGLQASKLAKHLVLVDGCASLHKALSDMNTPVADLDSALKVVMGDGSGLSVELPELVKQKLLGRRLRDMVHELLQGTLTNPLPKLVETLSPFRQHGCVGESEGNLEDDDDDGEVVDEVFEPMAPRMSALDKVPGGKVQLATKIFVLDVLQELVKGGGDFSTRTLQVCQAFLQVFERELAVAEKVPAAMEKGLIILRAMVALLDYSPEAFDSEDILALKAATSSHKDDILQDACLILEHNPWYKALLDDFIRTMADSKRNAPTLAELEKALTKCGSVDSESLARARESMELIKTVKPIVRQGMSEPLQRVCANFLEGVYANLTKMDEDGQIGEVTYIDEAMTCFDMARAMWPEAPVFSEAHGWCACITRQKADTDKLTRCAFMCYEVIRSDGAIDHGKLEHVRTAVEQCKGLTAGTDEDIGGFFRFLEAMLAVPKNLPLEPAMDLSVCHGVVALLPQSERKAVVAASLATMTVAVSLAEKTRDYTTPGDDASTRLSADPSRAKLSDLVRAMLVAKTHKEKSASLGQASAEEFLATVMGHASAVHDAAEECALTTAAVTFEKLVREKSAWAGGLTDNQVWHSTISATASVAELVDHANETIAKKSSKSYSAGADDILNGLRNYKSTCEFFGKAPQAELVELGEGCWRRMATSYYEGLLITAFGQKFKPVDLRDKVRAIEKKMSGERVHLEALGFDKIEPRLAAKADAAKMLRK